jgi:hypothetical protein
VDFGKGWGFSNGHNNTQIKEKNKSWEASVGLANLNRWQVESSYCQRFFPPLKTTKKSVFKFLVSKNG